MIKQYIVAGIFIAFVINQPVIAMWRRALTAVKVVTSGAIIGIGATRAYVENKKYCSPLNQFQDAPLSVKKMVYRGLVQLHVPNAENVPVKVVEIDYPWLVLNDKVIAVNFATMQAIEAGDKKVIMQSEAIKKHEIWHLLNKDGKKRIYAWVATPCVVQAVSSSLSYGCNKIVGRKPPKSIWSFMGRSLVAAGVSIPKGLLSYLGVIAYIRYQEVLADRFACEHAESCAELEAFGQFFINQERIMEEVIMDECKKQNVDYEHMSQEVRGHILYSLHFFHDKEHPRPADRAAIIQTYIDKWN